MQLQKLKRYVQKSHKFFAVQENIFKISAITYHCFLGNKSIIKYTFSIAKCEQMEDYTKLFNNFMNAQI